MLSGRFMLIEVDEKLVGGMLSACRTAARTWFIDTRAACVARKNWSFISTALADALNAAATATSSIAEIDRLMLASMMLNPRRNVVRSDRFRVVRLMATPRRNCPGSA